MKSITPVISTILLILITIAASASAYFFINSNVLELESQGNLESYPGMDNSRLIISSITGTRVLVINEGTSPVTEVIVFVNDELLNYDFSGTIEEDELLEIPLNPQPIGQDLRIKIIYNKGKIAEETSPARLNTNNSGFI